jgi:hypothetical protein
MNLPKPQGGPPAKSGAINRLQQTVASQVQHRAGFGGSSLQPAQSPPPQFSGVVKQAADKNNIALSALDNDPSTIDLPAFSFTETYLSNLVITIL